MARRIPNRRAALLRNAAAFTPPATASMGDLAVAVQATITLREQHGKWPLEIKCVYVHGLDSDLFVFCRAELAQNT